MLGTKTWDVCDTLVWESKRRVTQKMGQNTCTPKMWVID